MLAVLYLYFFRIYLEKISECARVDRRELPSQISTAIQFDRKEFVDCFFRF